MLHSKIYSPSIVSIQGQGTHSPLWYMVLYTMVTWVAAHSIDWCQTCKHIPHDNKICLLYTIAACTYGMKYEAYVTGMRNVSITYMWNNVTMIIDSMFPTKAMCDHTQHSIILMWSVSSKFLIIPFFFHSACHHITLWQYRGTHCAVADSVY